MGWAESSLSVWPHPLLSVCCPCPGWRPGQGHPRLSAAGKPPAQGSPTEPCPHAEAPGYPAQPSPAPARPPLTEASAFPPSPHCPLLGRAGCRVRGGRARIPTRGLQPLLQVWGAAPGTGCPPQLLWRVLPQPWVLAVHQGHPPGPEGGSGQTQPHPARPSVLGSPSC